MSVAISRCSRGSVFADVYRAPGANALAEVFAEAPVVAICVPGESPLTVGVGVEITAPVLVGDGVAGADDVPSAARRGAEDVSVRLSNA